MATPRQRSASDASGEAGDRHRRHWRATLRLVALCLVIWFVVSFVLGIVLVDVLNRFHIGGFPLGFWIAQQGSIYVFLLVIVFYVWRMRKIDAQHGLDED